MKQPPDLKILAPHPVQYQAPLFRELGKADIRIDVAFYGAGAASRASYDAEFGTYFAWDIDLLTGYPHCIFNEDRVNYGFGEQIRMAPRLLLWALRGRRTPLLLMGWFAEIIWAIWALRLLLHQPTMVICETTPSSFAATAKPRWRVALLSWLLRNTSACMYIGVRNRDFLISMGVPTDRLFPAPYSIDNARFSAESERLMPEREELCRRFSIDPHLPVFLFCGKLIPKKRPLELLEAYKEAGLQDMAQLLYVGDGALHSQILRCIDDSRLKHVHCIGFLNQSQMPWAYVLGEVLCLPSDPNETWGLVVNEALTCGRPVVLSDSVGSAPDLVGPGNGWIVPQDDHAALVLTLLSAYEKRREWPKMGREGSQRLATHTFKSMATGVATALSQIAPQQSGTIREKSQE